MAVTATLDDVRVVGDMRRIQGTITLDSNLAIPEVLTADELGLDIQVVSVEIQDNGSYGGRWADSSLFVLYRPEGGQPITVKDDDAAATAGVALYVHVDEVLEQGTTLAHLEAVNPSNLDGTGTITSGGATYYVRDDNAAATGGVALYFDEDAATADAKFLANTGHDCYVVLSNGELLKVKHSATPASAGVQVYFDEDAANAHQRLRFVSPTNADGTGYTSTQVSMARGGVSPLGGTNLAGIELTYVAYGKGTREAPHDAE